MKTGWLFLMLAGSLASAAASEANYVVIEARGAGFTPGQRVQDTTPLVLKESERLTLIGPDGKTLTLRGPFTGRARDRAGPLAPPAQALSALLATRDERISAIGVVRAGLGAGKLPHSGWLDAGRGGARCLREGAPVVFWRAQSDRAARLVISPADRSFALELPWPAGASSLRLPESAGFDQQSLVQVSVDQEEFSLAFHRLPASLTEPLMQAAWMMEKGCLQQADALLRALRLVAPHEAQARP
jgi:hypothetical protein